MDIVLACLTDPAHWTGATGVPNRRSNTCRSRSSRSSWRCLALPIGLYIGHTGRHANLAINIANIGRAIPSYALMLALLPLTLLLAPTIGYDPAFGLSVLPSLHRDALLAIPPILVGATPGSARSTATSSRPDEGWA